MIGTLINAGAIVAGGLVGLTFGHHLGPTIQRRLRIGLAGLTTYAGLAMVAAGLQSSGFRMGAKQLGIALLALSVGNLIGKRCGLQRGINRMGRWAKQRFDTTNARPAGATRQDPIEGFITCSLLFCVGPMAILGPIQDGLEGRWSVLAVKSLLDGLSAMGFVAAFGWGPLAAAVPVLLYQGGISLAAHQLEPLLAAHDLKDTLNITGGFIVTTIALVILEIRQVPLADYLPALPLSLLLAHWWLH